MLDNSQNPTQNDVSVDLQPTFNASDNVVKEPQKLWSLPTLERALLTVIGFFAYYLAFRFGRGLAEWQFGLTIILSAVLAITVPALYIENKRLTNQLSDGHSLYSLLHRKHWVSWNWLCFPYSSLGSAE